MKLLGFPTSIAYEVLFAVKVAGTGEDGPAVLVMKGQTCSESTCKNIEATLTLANVKVGPGKPMPQALVPVRQ